VKRRIAIAVSLLCVASCLGREYRGDGHFVAKSHWPFPNYAVELPLSGPTERRMWTFTFTGVPAMDSTAGFTLVSRKGAPCPALEKSELSHRVVRLELRDDRGKVAASMNGPLTKWIWSYSGGGESGCEIYADTLFFKPRTEGTYYLTFATDRPWEVDQAVEVQVGSYAEYFP
jgi:hypothetical protein